MDADAARAAAAREGLESMLMLARTEDALPPRLWLRSLFGGDRPAEDDRAALLRGARAHGPPPSPTPCACHGISKDHIRSAIVAGAHDVAAIARACAAGTGCGSCKPELTALLAETLEPA